MKAAESEQICWYEQEMPMPGIYNLNVTVNKIISWYERQGSNHIKTGRYKQSKFLFKNINLGWLYLFLCSENVGFFLSFLCSMVWVSAKYSVRSVMNLQILCIDNCLFVFQIFCLLLQMNSLNFEKICRLCLVEKKVFSVLDSVVREKFEDLTNAKVKNSLLFALDL